MTCSRKIHLVVNGDWKVLTLVSKNDTAHIFHDLSSPLSPAMRPSLVLSQGKTKTYRKVRAVYRQHASNGEMYVDRQRLIPGTATVDQNPRPEFNTLVLFEVQVSVDTDPTVANVTCLHTGRDDCDYVTIPQHGFNGSAVADFPAAISNPIAAALVSGLETIIYA